jgi:peptidoglycan hydrolase-like protein with peptidoglycan-binding domain
MRTRWFTYLALVCVTALLVGPVAAQTSGSGSSTTAPGTGSGSGTTGPTQPQPSPSTTQPSVTAPGKAMPSTQPSGSSQTGSGQTGSAGTGAGKTQPMAADGQADPEQVKNVQKALQEKGMDPGPIDGIMGPKTMAALRAYQKDQKLPETGRLDAQTREKLGVSR